MADNKTGSEDLYDPNTGKYLGARRTVSGGTAAGAVATGAMQDASKIGVKGDTQGAPKAMPNESPAAYARRFREWKEAKAQSKGLDAMSKPATSGGTD